MRSIPHASTPRSAQAGEGAAPNGNLATPPSLKPHLRVSHSVARRARRVQIALGGHVVAAEALASSPDPRVPHRLDWDDKTQSSYLE